MNINEAANILCNFFLNNSFVVQRYNAYSSNSVYIKLDYGVCHTIRISDHRGKKHLAYRYNFLTNVKGTRIDVTKEGHRRFFYGWDSGNELVRDILQSRSEMIDRYGWRNYQKYRHENYLKNKDNTKGFWSKAKTL